MSFAERQSALPRASQPQAPGPRSIAADVLEGLTTDPKRLPPRLFYDDFGSELFEQITRLPEYYLTRTEGRILKRYADEITRQAGPDLSVVELGAGSAAKTRILLHALLKTQARVLFCPVDISRAALAMAVTRLNGELRGVEVRPLLADYSHGISQIAAIPGRKLVLYIGSSIGNFEPLQASATLSRIRTSLAPGDALLLGVDMVRDRALLVPAYDDARGVTAAFNKNVLTRINRELGGHFDLDTFSHLARYNAKYSRVEMHLESTRTQVVAIDAIGLKVHFRAGETIHTENSYKFSDAMVRSVLRNAGFTPERAWKDGQKRFGLQLARVISC